MSAAPISGRSLNKVSRSSSGCALTISPRLSLGAPSQGLHEICGNNRWLVQIGDWNFRRPTANACANRAADQETRPPVVLPTAQHQCWAVLADLSALRGFEIEPDHVSPVGNVASDRHLSACLNIEGIRQRVCVGLGRRNLLQECAFAVWKAQPWRVPDGGFHDNSFATHVDRDLGTRLEPWRFRHDAGNAQREAVAPLLDFGLYPHGFSQPGPMVQIGVYPV